MQIAAPNPPSSGAQDLYGRCEETYPSCIDRDAHRVEKALGVRSKPFQRTISDEVGNNSPQHIRTKQAICKAMKQLVSMVDTAREDVASSELSSYVHDRFRAIRQEMELQHIRSSLTAKLLEPMIRLTAIKAHEMCQDKDYQSALVMDRKELAKMFLSLKALYTAHRQMGQKLATEAEFTAYLILLKGQQDLQTAQHDGLTLLLLDIPEHILADPSVLWALAVVDAIEDRNYVQFVKLLLTATYVQACFLHMLFLEEARDWRMAAMTQAFKLKRALLSQIQEMLFLDDIDQVRSWLRMRDDKECLVSDDGLEVSLPTNPRPQGRAQVVSERILRKRNGASLSSLMTSALASGGTQSPSISGSPIAAMFSVPASHHRQRASRLPAHSPSPSPEPHQFLSPQQRQAQLAAQVAEPDLARAASEHKAATQAAEQLAVEHKAGEQAAAEKAAISRAAHEKAAAEQQAAETQAAKEAAEAAERRAAEEREAARQAVVERAAQQAAAAEAKKRAAQEAARLEELRRQDAAFRRAGQNLEEQERQGWVASEHEYASNVAFARQLRKRYREQVAHAEAEEQAEAQAQQEAQRLMLVKACSFHTPPSLTLQKLQEQACRDQRQAAGVKNVVVAELAFSRLHLESDAAGTATGTGTGGKVMAASTWGVTGCDGDSGRGPRHRPPALQPPVGALAGSVATVPLSPDCQPVLQRPKVLAMRCDELVGSARDSARFHASEVRGAAPVKPDIPVVSRLRSFVSTNRGR